MQWFDGIIYKYIFTAAYYPLKIIVSFELSIQNLSSIRWKESFKVQRQYKE